MFIAQTVSINDLILDHENPRFTTRDNKNFSQPEIIQYLIDYEELLDLAKKINDYGGFTAGERIIATKVENKYIVLEGNRRTASLKILMDPNLVNNSIKLPKVTEACKQFAYQIPIDVVPSRSDADRALLTRHIEGIKLWSTFSKMKFYRKMIDNGRSIEEISNMSLDSKKSIAKTLHQYSLLVTIIENYKLFFPDSNYLSKIAETKLDTDLILNRLFNFYIKTLNITFSQNYELILPSDPNKKDLLLNILVCIAKLQWEDEKINTRILNKNKDINDFFMGYPVLNELHASLLELIEKYLNNSENEESLPFDSRDATYNKDNSYEEDLPPSSNNNNNSITEKSNNKNTNSKEDLNITPSNNSSDKDLDITKHNTAVNSNGENAHNEVKQPKPKERKYLFEGILYLGSHPGIKHTLYELQQIDYKKFKLSAVYLVRTLIECTLQEYLSD